MSPLYSIVGVKFPWPLYTLAMVILRLLFMDLDWWGYLSFALFFHQFLLLFYSIGTVMPIRYLAGLFMILQMLVGPTLAYNGLDDYQRLESRMQIPAGEYYLYAFPAVFAYILGLNFQAGKLKGEYVRISEIKEFVDRTGILPVLFIGVGFAATILQPFFGSALGFVFTLLSKFRFVGLFMLILGREKLHWGWIAFVYGSLLFEAIQRAMFHDLVTWSIMLGAVLAIKYKPNILFKSIITSIFLFLVVILQLLKKDYRQVAWGGEGGSVEALDGVIESRQESGGLINWDEMARSNIRINQGYILTYTMQNVPQKQPFANGSQLKEVLEAAILPRILAPNKLNAGDRLFFIKWSGLPIARGTSMGLGPLGDGYVNFGILGGIFFMFFLGLFYSAGLKLLHKYSAWYPALLLFTPLIFSYPIRPDCELQTSLGHFIKSLILLFFVFQVIKYQFFNNKMVRFRKPVMEYE